MNKFLVVLLCVCTVWSCQKDKTEPINVEELVYSSSPFDLGGIDAKFASNISYGADSRNLFDIFLPHSNAATPLVIYIHGGGFTSGDKSFIYEAQKGGIWDFPSDIRHLLEEGIAVATLNYRLINEGDTEGVTKSLNDSKRCLQFIRSYAQALNIDPSKIALAGNSAGAGTALWLATHDDMADPTNEDAVLHESTKVSAIAIRETQASYDLQRWEDDVFVDYNFSLQDFINNGSEDKLKDFYGLSDIAEFNSSAVITVRNDIDMLDLISADDAPIWVDNTLREVVAPSNLSVLYHHAYHAREIEEQANNIGVEIVAKYGTQMNDVNEDWIDFLIRHL